MPYLRCGHLLSSQSADLAFLEHRRYRTGIGKLGYESILWKHMIPYIEGSPAAVLGFRTGSHCYSDSGVTPKFQHILSFSAILRRSTTSEDVSSALIEGGIGACKKLTNVCQESPCEVSFE